MKRTFRNIIILVALCMGLKANAETLTLEQCISQALANNLQMKNYSLAVAEAKDMQGTAFDVEQTGITLKQSPVSGGGTENGIVFSQSFDFPTVYVARHKALKAQRAVAESEQSLYRNELIKEVSLGYYKWLYVRQKERILLSQDSVYADFLRLASVKYAAGETNQLERMNAQRLLSENQMALKKVQNEQASAKMALLRLLNRADSDDIAPADSMLEAIHGEPTVLAVDFSSTPLGANYAARISSGERNVSLAKQGFAPKLSVAFTTQAVIQSYNPYKVDRSRFEQGNFMGFEVGVSVPLFFGSQLSRVKAESKALERVRNERTMADRQMQSQWREAYDEYQRAKQALEYYQGEGNSQASELRRIAQVTYENAEISYVEYIQNLISALDEQLRYCDALNDYNISIINLNYLNANDR